MNLLSAADVDAYLRRLDITTPLPSDPLAALALIHEQHSFVVPFENLDILLRRPPSLNPADLVRKIVGNRRGGYCYEVNGLLQAVLRTLGYECACLSARILFGSKQLHFRGHQLLRVRCGGTDLLMDVGYRNGPLAPIPLRHGVEVTQHSERFRILQQEAEWLLQKSIAGTWHDLYAFSTDPWLPVDFTPHNYYNAHSADSIFTQGPILMIKTRDGHHAIVGQQYSEMRYGKKEERAITSAEAFDELLRTVFGLGLPAHEVGRLLPTAAKV